MSEPLTDDEMADIGGRYLADRNGVAAFVQSDHAAEDVPRLLATIDALTAEVARLRGALKACKEESAEALDFRTEDETYCYGNHVHIHRIALAALATPQTGEGE